MATVRFTDEHVELFARLSHDVSPLHVDETYASRTPFGERVVHGALAALTVLGRSTEAPVWNRHMWIRFPRPLFRNVSYELAAEGDAGRRKLKLGGGKSIKLLHEGELEGRGPFTPQPGALPFEPRSAAATRTVDDLAGLAVSGRYQVDTAALAEARRIDALGLERVAPLNIAALAWASYLIGMELPGQRALFHSVRCKFEPAAEGALEHTGFDFSARVKRIEAATRMAIIEAELSDRGERLATATLQSIVRNDPVEYGLADLADAITPSSALAGRACLVTGSSRGLGALIALACARRGADVIVHYRRNETEARRIQDAITQLGRRCELVGGDVAQPDTWRAIASMARDRFGRLDVLVNNAYPPIHPLELDEMDAGWARAQIHAPLDSAVLAHQSLLPLLQSSRGCVVNISSAYVADPPPGMAYYAMVKTAVESLAASAARAHPAVRFVTVRPPRILTDQTNAAFDPTRAPMSPVRVVCAIIDAIENGPTGAVDPLLIDTF